MRTSLDLLRDKYPGVTLLCIAIALKECGWAPQTGYNRISSGRGLPFPTSKQGKNHIVHILDLAEYLDSVRGAENTKRRRGRPTKAEQVARARAKEVRT